MPSVEAEVDAARVDRRIPIALPGVFDAQRRLSKNSQGKQRYHQQDQHSCEAADNRNLGRAVVIGRRCRALVRALASENRRLLSLW